MKRISYTFCILLSSCSLSYSQEGWIWQNPLPQGNDLYHVFFIDDNAGWAVGRIGTILKTTDGGISWNFQSSGSTDALREICFIDENTGWVIGGQTILKTTDGGEHWFK